MKNILLVSRFGFSWCLMCWEITKSLSCDYIINTTFLCDDEIIDLKDEINNHDFVVLIGYSEAILNNKEWSSLKGKLMLLTPLEENLGSSSITQRFYNNNLRFTVENWQIINRVIENIFYNVEEFESCDLTKQEEVLIATGGKIGYLSSRYERCMQVLNNFYGLSKIKGFHQSFFLELVLSKKSDNLETILKKHEKSSQITKQLISSLKISGNSGFVSASNHYFFMDKIMKEADRRGLPMMIIEYIDRNNKYITVCREFGSEVKTYLSGAATLHKKYTWAVKMN